MWWSRADTAVGGGSAGGSVDRDGASGRGALELTQLSVAVVVDRSTETAPVHVTQLSTVAALVDASTEMAPADVVQSR